MSPKALSRSQHAAGLTTLAAMLLAEILDNSPPRAWYDLAHHLPVSVRAGELAIDKPLILWINEGLMVFFFLLIALELKREILEGQLSTPKAIATPGFAALGGMVVSALIYTTFNASDPLAMRGWAIPAATDTVLALTVLAVLALLGARVPALLKVFLTALAIFDDLSAILIIALFYTERLAMPSLVMAAFGIAALIGLNVFNVTRTAAYVVADVFLWFAVLKSGVHATLAGGALVAGIGFTMSLFIAGLAFPDPEPFRNARLSVIAGSLLSAAAGVAVLWSAGDNRLKAAPRQTEPFP